MTDQEFEQYLRRLDLDSRQGAIDLCLRMVRRARQKGNEHLAQHFQAKAEKLQAELIELRARS